MGLAHQQNPAQQALLAGNAYTHQSKDMALFFLVSGAEKLTVYVVSEWSSQANTNIEGAKVTFAPRVRIPARLKLWYMYTAWWRRGAVLNAPDRPL